MSERSSESSCEWVVLNEDEEDCSAENLDQSLNEELSYDALSNAICDSIRSSLTSEELEWQYEVFDDYSPPQEFPHIEDLDPVEFNIGNTAESISKAKEDGDSSHCSLIDEYEKDDCLNVASSPKVHSYKHDRNDRLNFILNILLALAVSLAVGLGTGHFLGWSHKCFKSSHEVTKAATGHNKYDLLEIKQNFENKIKELEEKIIISQSASENIQTSTSCSNLKDGGILIHEEALNTQPNNKNIISDAALALPENSMYSSSDVLELKTESNQNLSDSAFPLGFVTDFDWSKISNADVSVETIELSSNAVLPVDNYLFYKDEVNNIPHKMPKEFYFDNTDFIEDKIDETSSVNVDELSQMDEVGNLHVNIFKQFDEKDTSSFKEAQLTNQLRKDLNQVIGSLTVIAITRLTDFDKKHTTPEQDSEAVVKLYNDFQNLIQSRITDIDDFVHGIEYKTHDKSSVKYLQRMVYSLVDAVDHLMKVSFKALNRRDGRINVHKYSNNVAKVIFNFNKKWEKNKRFWGENVKKFKGSEFVKKPFKKENRHWKKTAPVENSNYQKNKFRRFAMKS